MRRGGIGQLVAIVPLEQRHQLGVADDGHAHRTCHALDRHVVVRRPHAARGEDEVEGLAEGGDFFRDERDLVRDDGDASHLDAQLTQLAAEVGGVGVDGLAGQDLVADEDDAGRLRHGVPNSTTLSTRMLDLTP